MGGLSVTSMTVTGQEEDARASQDMRGSNKAGANPCNRRNEHRGNFHQNYITVHYYINSVHYCAAIYQFIYIIPKAGPSIFQCYFALDTTGTHQNTKTQIPYTINPNAAQFNVFETVASLRVNY